MASLHSLIHPPASTVGPLSRPPLLAPSEPAVFNSFTRYLSAKRTLDDRALNAHVWHTFATALPPATRTHPLRVLEAGAGIGTMVERVLERELFDYAHYLALDLNAESIRQFRLRLPAEVCEAGRHLSIEACQCDVLDFAAAPEHRGVWDVLIAHAFLDLLPLPTALPTLLGVLRPGGLFYFTLVFDGATIFEPAIDPALDAQIEALYHRTMDERMVNGAPSGDRHSGRHLLRDLQCLGASVLAAGSSDWVVMSEGGRYRADEAYFLHFIINTVAGALRGHPELCPDCFERWLAERHAQIERGELIYIAHQVDVVGRWSGRG